MNDTLEIREARADEIALVQELIREMAKYDGNTGILVLLAF